MKRIIMLILTLVMVASSTIVASAESEPYVFEYDCGDVEYVITVDSDGITEEQAAAIADAAYSYSDDAHTVTGRSSTCPVAGYHAFVTVTRQVYNHRVRVISPRCEIRTYEMEICAYCEYVVSSEFIGAVRIVCCEVE